MKRYLIKRKGLFIMYVMFSILASFPAMFLVYLDQFIVHVAEKKLTNEISKCVILIILFFVSFITIAYAFQFIKNKFLQNVQIEIKQDLFQGIMHRKIVDFNGNDTSYYVSLYNNDLKLIEEKYILAFFSLIMDLTEFIFGSIYALWINAYAGLFMITIAFFSLLLPKFLAKGLSKLNDNTMTEYGRYNSKLRDAFSGFETIKTFNAEKQFISEHKKWNHALEGVKFSTNFRIGRVRVTNNVFTTSSQLFLLALSGFLVITDRIDLSLMVALLQLSGSIFYPMSSSIDYINDIKSTKSIRAKVETLLNEAASEKKAFNQIDHIDSVEYKRVAFHYPNTNQPVLEDISFKISDKQKILIAGESGCGKSTILKLLLKYYPPTKGDLLINGKDINQICIHNMYDKIAYVPQAPFIFNDCLKNNITLYKTYTDDEIYEAIDKASLHSLIKRLDQGIDTIMTENGNNFSGGEKQRIAIARAYLSGKSFFLIDEMTSALDTNTAKQIEEMLLKDRNITCIVISHRFNKDLLPRYDHIIALDKGIVSEDGTYEELYAKKKVFYNLCHELSS